MNEQRNEPQPELESGSDAMLPAHTARLHPVAWVILGLLIAFLILASFFLYQQSQRAQVTESSPTSELPSPTSHIPSPISTLAVPTISENTSLETIEQELNSLEIASPDSELNQLDKEAEQL